MDDTVLTKLCLGDPGTASKSSSVPLIVEVWASLGF